MSSCNCARLGTLNYSRHSSDRLARYGARTTQVVKRYASSAAALKPKRNITSQASVPEVLTALHKTSAFLPRILPRGGDAAQETQSVEFWDELLDKARDSLSAASVDRVARVVVYGYNTNSGAEELVSALLQEPFASEPMTKSIQNRGVPSQTDLIIRSDPSASDPASKFLTLQSSWLQQFPLPIELHELRNSQQSRSKIASQLFSADIPIIVCNPLTTSLEKLFSDTSLPLHHPNAILVLTSSATSSCADIVNQYHIPPTLRVLSVDPTEALQGLDSIRSNPGSSLAVQRYQDSFTHSGIPDVTSSIAQRLSLHELDTFKSLRTQTATYILQASLSACRVELYGAGQEVERVKSRVSQLRDQVLALREGIHTEAFGSNDGRVVQDAIAQAKQIVQPTMDRLTWWRLLWKVDDIADIVTSSVNRAWCRRLEDQLIFLSGRLSSNQDNLAAKGKQALLDSPQGSYFRSSILQNAVAQLERSPKYHMTYDALTEPIYIRRNQLLYPTNMLHSTAQRVTIGMGGSVISGFGIAWAGWAGQLGLLGVYGSGMETESAVGLGLLTASFGIRWAVGRWERAKKRWWKDWDRVGQGLERDLKVSLDRTVQNQVAVVPIAVCEGIGKLVSQRESEMKTLTEELCVLDKDAHRIISSPP